MSDDIGSKPVSYPTRSHGYAWKTAGKLGFSAGNGATTSATHRRKWSSLSGSSIGDARGVIKKIFVPSSSTFLSFSNHRSLPLSLFLLYRWCTHCLKFNYSFVLASQRRPLAFKGETRAKAIELRVTIISPLESLWSESFTLNSEQMSGMVQRWGNELFIWNFARDLAERGIGLARSTRIVRE